jgi:hypothetical protein
VAVLPRRLVIFCGAVLVAGSSFVPSAAATVPPGDQPPVTNEFLDLERDVTECISSMPKPGCGREPTDSGDRGGWQQTLVFGILMLGMAGIGTRVAFAVRKRDRG